MAQKREYVEIMNISKQMIPLQVKPPGGDFYIEEQQIRLRPGKSAVVPKDHLLWSQIENCKARGQLKVTPR